MTTAESDLVGSLRAELAAIDPHRRCCRIGRVGRPGRGLRAAPSQHRASGPAVESGPAGRPCGSRRRRRRPEPGRSAPGCRIRPGRAVRLGPRRRALPHRLPARPIPRPRLAESGLRPNAPGVRARGRRRADSVRPARRIRDAGPSGASAAAAAWSPGRAWRRSPRSCKIVGGGLRPAGAGVPAGLAIGAWRSEPRHQRRVGQPQRAVAASARPARRDRDPRRPTAGWPNSRTWCGSWPMPAARNPRPHSPSWPPGCGLHRSSVQRALERCSGWRSTGRTERVKRRGVGTGAAAVATAVAAAVRGRVLRAE